MKTMEITDLNAKIRILIADNDPAFSKALDGLLEQEGYQVLLASSPAEARRLLEQGGIDVALIDVRLQDDSDANDLSGLEIAEGVASSVPKIVLTSYPTVDTIRAALSFRSEGLPKAVDFMAKQEGPEKLLASIKRAVAVYSDKSPKRVVLDISEQLEKDYEESRKQAVFTHRIRLVLIVVGSLVIIVGGVGVLLGKTTAGLLSVLSGAIVEALAGLFSKISEDANKRMDSYHGELLKLYVEQK